MPLPNPSADIYNPPSHLYLAGYSYGSCVAASALARCPQVSQQHRPAQMQLVAALEPKEGHILPVHAHISCAQGCTSRMLAPPAIWPPGHRVPVAP